MSKKVILLDLLAFSPTDGGFSKRVTDMLSCLDVLPDFKFVALINKKYESELSEFPVEKIAIVVPPKIQFYTSLLVIPWLLRKRKFDALHCEISAIPFGITIPASVTVCDLYFLINPKASGKSIGKRLMQFYWSRVFVRSLNRAKIIAVISETTRRDIYKLTTARTETVLSYPKIDWPQPVPVKSLPDNNEVVRLLFLGSIVPRKNLPILLEAMPKFNRKVILDVCGNKWWGAQELDNQLSDSRVRVHGYIDEEKKTELLRQAHFFIMPSFYEGFGIPAAEAIAHGCLALTSRGSAFDEYIPDQCRFDPNSSDDLARCVNSITPESYQELLRISQKSVRHFSKASLIASYNKLFSKLISCNSSEKRP